MRWDQISTLLVNEIAWQMNPMTLFDMCLFNRVGNYCNQFYHELNRLFILYVRVHEINAGEHSVFDRLGNGRQGCLEKEK